MTWARAPVEKPTVRGVKHPVHGGNGRDGTVDTPSSPSSPPQEGARATVYSPHFFQVAGGLSPSLMAGATGDGKPLPDVKGFAVNPRLSSGASWPAADERRAARAPRKPPGKGANPEPGGRG